LSQHRSSPNHPHKPERVNPHKAYRRPLKRRSKALVVSTVAIALCGAASLAHANFGNGQLNRTSEAPTAGVATWNDLNLRTPSSSAEAGKRWWWPTTPAPTTAQPTPTKPPSTPAPTTPSSPTPTTPSTTQPPPSSGSGSWPGQIPGRFYLGMSCAEQCATRGKAVGADYGVHRTFKQWGNWSGVEKEIAADHDAGRLPWVSVKPPGAGPDGWRKVSSGAADAEIRSLAAVLKANDDDPTLLTFHHEPSNDGAESDGKLWAAAYAHFHDVLKAAGALKNVADPPILGDWLFNPTNKQQDPANWATDAVLSRAPFMGIDLYQNSSGKTMGERIPIIRDYLADHGYPKMMVGIGETGSTDKFTNTTAAKWLDTSLAWVAANTDKVGVVSYFNSTNNSKTGVYWPLDESAAKMAAYRSWLNNNKIAKLG
jgi:hypothetical protein